MTVTRSYSAGRINEIVNHPEVLPWVRGATRSPLDLTEVVADERNVLLLGEHGGVLFAYQQPAIYEAHTQVLPEGRGWQTVEMVNAALTWMFCRTDAHEILTRCPEGNLGAKALVRAIKGEFQFTAARGWANGAAFIPADVYAMTVQSWAKHATGLVERGRWFHERLEAEYTRLGIAEQQHEDDDCHDRYVGAAAEMILGGQPQKAIAFYNRWAALSGYAPLALLNLNPLVINIRDAWLCVDNGNFEVIKCQ